MTIAAIAQGVLSTGQAAYGAYQAREGQKAAAALGDQFSGTAAERAAMLNSARDQSLMNRALDEANAALGTGVQALQGMGARGAGAVSGLVRSAGDTTASITARQKAMEDQARQQLIQGNAMDSGYRRQMQMQQMQNAQQAQMAGVQNIGNALMSAASGFVDLASSGNKDKTTKPAEPTPGSETIIEDKISFNRNDKRTRDAISSNIERLTDARSNALGEDQVPLLSRRPSVEAGPVAPPTIVPDNYSNSVDYEGLFPTTGGGSMMRPIASQYPVGIGLYEQGGSAGKTPGVFSHKNNPIHMVRQGTKIGEMTGGEYIFNPSQAASLRKHSKDGNTELHKYVRRLLSKPQFK